MTLLGNRKEHLISQDETKSDDCLQSHSTHHHLTRRLDDEDAWDGLASEVKKVAETLAKALRKTHTSLSSLDQRISALRKKYQG